MSVFIFDLETTGFDALAGELILCCGLAPLGSDDAMLLTNDNVPVTDDKELAISIRDTLEAAEGIISWNGHKFDLPFLNDRLRRHGEKPLLHLNSMDLMLEMKKLIPYFGSNIGAKLEDYMIGLGLPYVKTQFSPPIWYAAVQGDPEAMEFITSHCVADVKATRAIFEHYYTTEVDE